jgi:hypothetical protein
MYMILRMRAIGNWHAITIKSAIFLMRKKSFALLAAATGAMFYFSMILCKQEQKS